jgi:signal peptidase I
VAVRDRVLTGDRILVEKITRPQRWDLIVFKYPEQPSTNFIKRLVGLPGETLEIVAGDIFIDGRRLRKPPGTADDMWLLAHDSGYIAKQALPEGPRWQAKESSSHWHQTGGKWVFTGTEVEGDALWFSGRLTDELAYNGQQTNWGPPNAPPPPLVGDVRVEFCTDGFSGEGGSLAFRWEFAEEQVTATISTSGMVEIVSSAPPARAVQGQGTQKTSGDLPGDMNEKQRLAFCFRDGWAYAMQNGTVVASLLVGPEDAQTAKDRPQPDAKPCRVEIVASRCLVTLSRIQLWKDVHYRSLEEVTGGLDYAGPQWGSTGHPVVLGTDDHFTLGDNSARSKDSRFWGTVGSDQIIGVARWIYWPPARSHQFR